MNQKNQFKQEKYSQELTLEEEFQQNIKKKNQQKWKASRFANSKGSFPKKQFRNKPSYTWVPNDDSQDQFKQQTSQYANSKGSFQKKQFRNEPSCTWVPNDDSQYQSKCQDLQFQGLQRENIDQKQEEKEKDQEQKLLEIIQKFQRLVDEFNKNNKQNMSVVLLVGVTGSGKSTIFNFLSGADFIFNQNYELEIKNPSNNFSKMASGMKSITKELHFYHNQKNNHLIIDFPGFQDTDGEYNQLLFQLLFHKIITSGPIKVIYVVKNTESSLPDRGSNLQEFINQLCQKGNINIQKFNLLLNCYLEDLTDVQLQNKIKKDLECVNKLQLIDKLLVIRKAKNENEIQQIFNNKQQQFIWQQIEQMQSIQIQPQKLPKSEIISDYIRNKILQTIEQYGIVLNLLFDQQYNNLSHQQSKTTITQMQKLLDLVNNTNQESSFEWYTKYIQTCEQLANSLSIQDEIVIRSNNFIKIFKYYSQFSHIIQGYDDLKVIKIIAKDQLNTMNTLIRQRLEIIQTQEYIKDMKDNVQQQNSIILEQQKNLENFNSKINKQDQKIESYQSKIKQLQMLEEDKTQEIKLLNNRLEEAKHLKNSLNNQQQQKKYETQELLDKINQYKEQMNQVEKLNQQNIKKLMNYIENLLKKQSEVSNHYHYKTETKWCQLI